jgi:hypothetical protein
VYTALEDGASCPLSCFGNATCTGGQCVPDSDTQITCPASESPCIDRFECDATTGECSVAIYKPSGADCDSDDSLCSIESCDGEGTCQQKATEICDEQQKANPCWTWSCNQKAGCVQTQFVAGVSCVDNNPCTTNDTCVLNDFGQEGCLGTPVQIDDNNPCTDDACVAGEVLHTPVNGVPCIATDGCDSAGLCNAGTCVATTSCGCNEASDCPATGPCSQSNCTNGQCASEALPDGSACDDGDACTNNNTCTAGTCGGGTAMVCDDLNPCTDDACLGGQCVSTLIPDCQDACPGGCDDQDPCTDDSCDLANNTCVHSNNNNGCNDNNACTAPDQCSGGVCQAGNELNCDDNNACTVDTCDTVQGCQHIQDTSLDDCETLCTPFETAPCYEGPEGTEGVGECKSGTKTCHAHGLLWSPCYGEVTPLPEDICDNGLDDDCSGTDDDAPCDNEPGNAIWVDGKEGSDETGTGSFVNPFATISKGVSAGKKLVLVKSDANGTTYTEKVSLGGSHHNIVLSGWGPTRPTLSGQLYIVHCYDCTVRDFVLEYPKPVPPNPIPKATLDTVHNYRNTFANIRFTAPHGLPGGKRLADTHHGYDCLFIDVEVDDIVLAPGPDDSANYTLLNWHDHGSGSQFIRPRLRHVTFAGTQHPNLQLTFLSAWGYCDQNPKGVTAIRNALATGLDLNGMASNQTTFTAFDLGCYNSSGNPAGFAVTNNTVANVSADHITALNFSFNYSMATQVSSNIFGPFNASSTTGVKSTKATTIHHSNLFNLDTPTTGSATLGAGVLALDPGFVNAAGGDFHLLPGSPCINTGDPALLDPDGSLGDMGAFGGPFHLP